MQVDEETNLQQGSKPVARPGWVEYRAANWIPRSDRLAIATGAARGGSIDRGAPEVGDLQN